jgi:hypothetical protein
VIQSKKVATIENQQMREGPVAFNNYYRLVGGQCFLDDYFPLTVSKLYHQQLGCDDNLNCFVIKIISIDDFSAKPEVFLVKLLSFYAKFAFCEIKWYFSSFNFYFFVYA